ncbi:hypothetical protein Plim_0068 [Planctopirus limnophila DSM 3776]|uniref:Zinc-ribbon domain-containing protein n=1 Tax=Planctopirus limnophila (strain ATCC 43296 / DSM 3776 / IFAM 1008 / Mu 290) TaxID=521674 RepID=D5SMK1_PLAL2|nr:zinc ribbon domain-containing protein [Planctopirus limnophila]ADG65921.1 hypothetical protein Plim_0068 [Planctopirus limnophila DSM 3776]
MPLKVRCKACGTVVTAPDAARGKAIRCPDCESKIPVPAGDSKATASKKGASAKSSKSASGEDGLANLDLSDLEDSGASICRKCGTEVDPEATECPNCGIDLATGGLGETARKKQMKGPDPDKFYENLWSESWKFALKYKLFAFRTMMYLLVSSTIMFGSAFMLLWVSSPPPRYFWGLIAVVSVMAIPGWFWFLDTEIIKATMERKDKLPRINFDFFLCSSLGLQAVAWQLAFALPLLAVPYLLGWFVIVPMEGLPLSVKIAYFLAWQIPIASLLPAVMSHMSMPVSYPGWMFWKLLPGYFKTIKASWTWTGMFLLTNLLPMIFLGLIIGLSAEPLVDLAKTMDNNGQIVYAKWQVENNPIKADKPGGVAPANPFEAKSKEEIKPPNYFSLILPSVFWVLACLSASWTAVFNMRTNGQFAYFNKNRLGLIGRAKEYKYVAKEKTDEDEVAKPKGVVDAVAVVMVCGILGAVGGLVTSSFADLPFPMLPTMAFGAASGFALASFIGWCVMLAPAFRASMAIGLLMIFFPLIGAILLYNKEPEETKFGLTAFLGGALLEGIAFGVFFVTAIKAVVDALPPPDPAAGAAPALWLMNLSSLGHWFGC